MVFFLWIISLWYPGSHQKKFCQNRSINKKVAPLVSHRVHVDHPLFFCPGTIFISVKAPETLTFVTVAILLHRWQLKKITTRVVLNHESGVCEHYYNNLNFRAILANVRLAINRGRQIAGLRKWRENSNCYNNAHRCRFHDLRQF